MTGDSPGTPPEVPVGDDPLVGAALRHLPVPEHGPAFWEALDARLEAERAAPVPPPAAPAVPPSSTVAPRPVPEPVPASVDEIRLVPVPSVVPAGMRRRSTAALAALAVAAVTVVAVAATTVVNRDPDAVDTAASPGTEAGDEIPGATEPPVVATVDRFTGTTAAPAAGYHGRGGGDAPDGGVESIAPAQAPSSAEEVAAAFVLAVEQGDVDATWHLLAPGSQAFWSAKERLAWSSTELAEGSYGAFRGARGLEVSILVLRSGPWGELGVVTLDGVVGLEGDERRRALDLPYRYDPATGAWLVDPWDADRAGDPDGRGGSPIAFHHPAPAERGFAALGASDAVEVAVPAWATEVTVAVDGAPLEVVRPSPPGTVRVQPPAPFAPGVHRLTVAAVGDDGTIVAASVLALVP